MDLKDGLTTLQKKLKKQYLSIADSHKLMAKYNDDLRLNAVQDHIDTKMKQTLETPSRMAAIYK